MPLRPGSILGQYRIGRQLGSGGMGEVYLATHLILGRDVALKTLRPEAVGADAQVSPLIREARAASALDHPNIVTVHDVANADGIVYIAMEYIEGQTLRQVLAQRSDRRSGGGGIGGLSRRTPSAARFTAPHHLGRRPRGIPRLVQRRKPPRFRFRSRRRQES